MKLPFLSFPLFFLSGISNWVDLPISKCRIEKVSEPQIVPQLVSWRGRLISRQVIYLLLLNSHTAIPSGYI